MTVRTDLLNGFRSLYRVDNAARATYFTEGIVVLDTNFILDLYRLSTTARSELMQILRGFGPRLLVPHQIAIEFHRRRVDAVVGRITEIEEVKASIRKAEAGARSILSQALQRAHGSSQMGKTSSDLITQTFESLRSNRPISRYVTIVGVKATIAEAGAARPAEARAAQHGRPARPPPESGAHDVQDLYVRRPAQLTSR